MKKASPSLLPELSQRDPIPAKVGIFGLGYVGLTTAACLIENGISVEGYEVSPQKQQLLKKGICPISEPGVQALIEKAVREGRFCVKDFPDGNKLPDLILICVGTPSTSNGSTDLRHVKKVFRQLNQLSAENPSFGTELIIRSTIPPGTLDMLRKLCPRLFVRVPVAFYPEFLREGTALEDFHSPPQSIIGSIPSLPKPKKIFSLLASFTFQTPVTHVNAVTAESLKFACNAYHAVKVSFANEIGRWITSLGGDPLEVMELFCRDTKLNTSSKYLRPGNPFGGSCLLKDTRSMLQLGKKRGINMPMIEHCLTSNQDHFKFIDAAIRSHKPRIVTILGIAFKKDSDDIRESPSVRLLRMLTAKKRCRVIGHDFMVKKETAIGVNQLLQNQLFQIPNFSLEESIKKALEGTDLVLIMHNDLRYSQAVAKLPVPVLNVVSWQGFQSCG